MWTNTLLIYTIIVPHGERKVSQVKQIIRHVSRRTSQREFQLPWQE